MNGKMNGIFIFLLSFLVNRVCASHISQIEVDVNFSLHIIVKENNRCRVERYSLQELEKGDNHITKKMSNAHCTHILNFGEPGMHITHFALDGENPRMLKVLAHRSKKAIHYNFDWGQLLLSDPEQAHRAMHAHAQVKEVNDEPLEKEEIKRGRWQSAVKITYGARGKQDLNLIFERHIDNVVAIIIPDILCHDCNNEIKMMKKVELVQTGLLVRAEETHSKTRAKEVCSDINCPANNSICSSNDNCSPWYVALYSKMVAKIAALKNTISFYCGG